MIDIEQIRADMEAAVERIRKYVDWPHTSPDTIVLDSDLVTITADDLASLLQQFDGEREQNRKLREVLEFVQSKITWELNPSNYNHEEVCDMNADWCEIGNAVDAALAEGETP